MQDFPRNVALNHLVRASRLTCPDINITANKISTTNFHPQTPYPSQCRRSTPAKNVCKHPTFRYNICNMISAPLSWASDVFLVAVTLAQFENKKTLKRKN